MKISRNVAAALVLICATPTLSIAQSCQTVLECAQEAVEAAHQANELARLLVPKGAVVAFNLESCPSGWSEYKPAYGRFVRGIDRSGGNLDPDGERAVGSIQAHQIEKHSHKYYGVQVAVPHNGGGHALGDLGRQNSKTAEVGGNETRPVNVALLYCERS